MCSRILENLVKKPLPLKEDQRVADEVGQNLVHLPCLTLSALASHESLARFQKAGMKHFFFLVHLDVPLDLQKTQDEIANALPLRCQLERTLEGPSMRGDLVQVLFGNRPHVVHQQAKPHPFGLRVAQHCTSCRPRAHRARGILVADLFHFFGCLRLQARTDVLDGLCAHKAQAAPGEISTGALAQADAAVGRSSMFKAF
eukprot:CAMPEP_0181451672 /NCGR_PEP_ID=MMETSP1110-20121109/28813_1 /TAXON_ID=174948 /ORGANISM="Symbiodinium sp., Strain CCMP421" /LENGTH=199 /DNA_ID=CAMNT_0023575933 /DNA_START=297 /DNA_END=893 /DNA_ORIENTATION=-